jgi:hypothetical protein
MTRFQECSQAKHASRATHSDLLSCLAYTSILQTEGQCSYETLANFQKTALCFSQKLRLLMATAVGKWTALENLSIKYIVTWRLKSGILERMMRSLLGCGMVYVSFRQWTRDVTTEISWAIANVRAKDSRLGGSRGKARHWGQFEPWVTWETVASQQGCEQKRSLLGSVTRRLLVKINWKDIRCANKRSILLEIVLG